VFNLDPNTVYYWRFAWGSEARVTVRTGGINGPILYNVGVPSPIGTYRPSPWYAYIGAPTEHTRIEVGVGVCGTAVARNEDMNVPDVTATDNYLACSLETKSELVVLIRSQDRRIVGQIDIDSHEHAAFGPEEERLVRDVAEALGERWLEEPAADRG